MAKVKCFLEMDAGNFDEWDIPDDVRSSIAPHIHSIPTRISLKVSSGVPQIGDEITFPTLYCSMSDWKVAERCWSYSTSGDKVFVSLEPDGEGDFPVTADALHLMAAVGFLFEDRTPIAKVMAQFREADQAVAEGNTRIPAVPLAADDATVERCGRAIWISKSGLPVVWDRPSKLGGTMMFHRDECRKYARAVLAEKEMNDAE